MATYLTTTKKMDPSDGQMKAFAGPNIEAHSFEEAFAKCELLGNCTLDGMLVTTIPCKEGTLEPDWEKAVEHDTTGQDRDSIHQPKGA